MRNIDVEKKRARRWPWGLGVIVLGAAVWGITMLLTPPPGDGPAEIGTTAADTLPPSAFPTTPGTPGSRSLQSVQALAPLADEDIGMPASARGVVLAVDAGGFWLRADTLVVRVSSSRRPREGDTVEVRGALRALGEAGDRAPERPGAILALEIVEEGAATPARN
jgi:hypothetical protein